MHVSIVQLDLIVHLQILAQALRVIWVSHLLSFARIKCTQVALRVVVLPALQVHIVLVDYKLPVLQGSIYLPALMGQQ